jgi:ribosomal 50S subunit-recycling heat shock protein
MRLDLFLKSSRLIPRRTLAQEFCDAGRISVNGAKAKSSKDIQAGDEIVIKRRNRVTAVKVNAIPQSKQVAKASAADLYDVQSDAVTPENDLLA